jgi:hypothetical protein
MTLMVMTLIIMIFNVRAQHHDIQHINSEYLNTQPGNTKGGSITVLLTSCLTGLNLSVLQKKIASCHTADSKRAKHEVNGTVILPPLVFPDPTVQHLSE